MNILSTKYNLLSILIFLSICYSYSQNGKVQGKVLLSDGMPAESANIYIESTTKGTVADSLGDFSLDLDLGTHKIMVSLIGTETHIEEVEILSDTSVVNLPIIILNGTEILDEVILEFKPKMHLQRHDGKLEVRVKNTLFEESLNVWEGMKQVPMMQIKDDNGVQIFGKNALVEVNGIRMQMTGEELETYLKSLDSGSVEKIELEPNPGATYESEIQAYINIVLKRELNNQRLALRTTNGMRTQFFNRSNINYNLNLEKINLYTNYSFNYSQPKSEGSVVERIGLQPKNKWNTENNEISRGHHAQVNLNYNLSEKDVITLNNSISADNKDANGLSERMDFKRTVDQDATSNQFQFAQVWTHTFNDSINLKVGAQQVFKNAKANNSAVNNEELPQDQFVKTDIPIYIGFVDYKNTNKLGTSLIGLRYRDISVTNENFEYVLDQEFAAPYSYKEKVLSAYLEHSIDINEMANLRFGVRTENSKIDYHFNALTTDDSFEDHLRYTNLLYNVQYSWATKNYRFYNLAFRKTIERPDYSALNPFQQISNDITYTTGDTNLNPAQYHSLDFYTYKGNWIIFTQTGYIKNFISNFYEVKDEVLTHNYRNFSHTYFAAGGLEYNNSFFESIWTTKTSAALAYFHLKDSKLIFDKFTPTIQFNSYNTIKITDNLHSIVSYSFEPSFQDGLFKHRGGSRLDISINKKLNDNFSLAFYAHDIFKTDRSWLNTTVPDYYYESKKYLDRRSFGLTIRYTISGKAYKEKLINEQNDSAIDRLN